jgi:transcriptional regulator with XRE-family HTH domain
MLTNEKKKETRVPIVLRRMRESSELTMREVGAMIGISHVAISQFENQKLNLPDYRIEQLVKAYGYTMDEFNKIIGKAIVISPKDDCYAMIDRMDDEQLLAVRGILNQVLRASTVKQDVTPVGKLEKTA